jgi:hypothetical protein
MKPTLIDRMSTTRDLLHQLDPATVSDAGLVVTLHAVLALRTRLDHLGTQLASMGHAGPARDT